MISLLFQQVLTGLANGGIIALIALGYTMVYGVVELINFAHGDVFMLGAFLALTIVGLLGAPFVAEHPALCLSILLVVVPLGCGSINLLVDRLAYQPLRSAPRLVALVSAIGVSYILLNIGLFWGGVPMEVFNGGASASAPKDFPSLVSSAPLLSNSDLYISFRDLFVFCVTIPLLVSLSLLVNRTRFGRAMRAVAQDPIAAQLCGIHSDTVIRGTFFIGGALAGFASVVYALYNNTIFFQMGYRVGLDAFTAAVLGGIGSLAGACIGGLAIGLIRALSDQCIATSWTNAVVFSVLILILLFRPSGILGRSFREKV